MNTQKQGFSIVELIVVIVVIAILITIAIVSYGWMRNDAIDAKTEATVTSIKKALQIKVTKTGKLGFDSAPDSKSRLIQDAYLGDLADEVDVYYQGVAVGQYNGKTKPVVDFTAMNTGVLIMSYNVANKQLVVDIIEQDYAHRQIIDNEQSTTVSYKPKSDSSRTCNLRLIAPGTGWRAGNIRRVCKSALPPPRP
ncbi:MAG: prepilin-type N-terminal cleavage/methylation domain-containing protein [Candidatus Saccharibacteria bacterium]|nr:prepilin-type N-terminal cleavage/methylation domain-containing protein [Candidatus Saccharibacteria bacterium]